MEENPFESCGHIYHPLPFPEFEKLIISSAEEAAFRKWKLIGRSLRLSNSFRGSVLDVGANAGFYSFNLAKLGARVDAFEPHKYYTEIGRQIAEATGLHVDWYNKPLDATDLIKKRYDIALMLSVFQWMSQGNERVPEATRLLRQVAASSRILFFELGCNNGKSAISTNERPLTWVWRLLCQATTPKQVNFLGTTAVWKGSQRFLFVCSDRPVHLTPYQRLITLMLQWRWIR